MSGLSDSIQELRARIAEIERRQRSQGRTGVVAQIDPAAGRARVRLLEGEQEFLTGWIPWAEAAAGANKTHMPPSVGQQVQIRSESGDLSDGVIQSSVNSEANGRPSGGGDEYVLASVGAASVTISGGGASLVLKVGGSTVTLTAGGVHVVGARVDLN